MRVYEMKMCENDMTLLSRAYYGYMAKRDIQIAILNGDINPTPTAKEQFDAEYTKAFTAYEQAKDYITTEVVPELNKRNFTWTADFNSGKLVITWNGEGNGPELPPTKYTSIITEV